MLSPGTNLRNLVKNPSGKFRTYLAYNKRSHLPLYNYKGQVRSPFISLKNALYRDLLDEGITVIHHSKA